MTNNLIVVPNYFLLVNLYVVNVTNLSSKFDDIENLVHNVSESLTKDNRQMLDGNEIQIKVDSVIPVFKKFLDEKLENSEFTPSNVLQNESDFLSLLSEFLFAGNIKWKPIFIFAKNESLVCGEKAPQLLGLRFPIHQFV